MSSRKSLSLVMVPDLDFKFVKCSSLRLLMKAMSALLALPIFASEEFRRRELDYSHRHFSSNRLRWNETKESYTLLEFFFFEY